MKKILILGSEGQIGDDLSHYCETSGLDVTRFDIVRDKSEDLRFPSKKLKKLVAGSDFVFFLAFDVGGSRYLHKYQNSTRFILNNLKILDNTFQTLFDIGTPFLFASSQMSSLAHSNYGLLKLIGERLCTTSQAKYVKFWNVYGFERNPEKSHVITDFIRMGVLNQPIKMETNGLESRDFTHARDASKALLEIAFNFKLIPEDAPLHVASHQWVTILSLAKKIGEKFSVPVIPSAKNDGIQNAVKLDPDPYLLKLWKPSITLDAGIDIETLRVQEAFAKLRHSI